MIKNNAREKGIALLFTLGMLSLILVMALAFTATSMVEMKSSVNNANRAVARLLAKSTVNKVAGLVQFYENVYFSHTQSGDPNYGHSDWLCKLDCDDIFAWDSSYASSVNWEYIKADDGSGTDKIVARYAYVVLPGGGVDPGDLVKAGVKEGDSVTVEERPGVEMNELNIGAFYESVYNRSTLVNNFNCNGTGTGVYNGAWLSFTNLFTQTGFGNFDSHRKFKTMLQRFCVIDAPNGDEAFWLDESGSGTVGDKDIDTSNDGLNELYHRFNIARTGATSCPDWNTITVDNLLGISPAFPTAADEFNSADANYDGYCIPWLKNWNENSGGWTNAQTKAKQIAANLIDYCDTDSIPKHDGNHTTYTAPTYIGLEKTAYINEVRLRFGSGTQPNVKKVWSAPNWQYSWGAINLDMRVEPIYMYNDASFTLGSVYYSYTINATINHGTGAPKPLAVRTNSASSSSWTSSGMDTTNRYRRSNNISLGSSWGAGNYLSAVDVGSTNFTITSISLKLWLTDSSGNLVDYAEISDAGSFAPVTFPGTNARYVYIKYEVDDPRKNNHRTDWTMTTHTSDPGWDGYGLNTVCNPNPGGDKDIEPGASSPHQVSTAYVRNAPMQSPWELGAIHRAAKWETLNLKKYNTTAGALSTGGGGSYADGDANILDQIKMCATNTSPKKVPVKTQAKELLQALFRGITVGNDYSAPGAITATRQITSTEAGNLADAFLAGNGTLRSRAELASIADLSSSTFEQYGSADVSLDNDAKKEEIIGKIVNLTENVKEDYFTVVAIAQSIKDIGGGITINNDLNYNGSIESSFNESGRDIDGDGETNTTGLSETTTNCQFGVYDPFADQILATQKVVAQIYRDPNTGACTILKFEYYD